MIDQEKYEDMLWIDLINDADELNRIAGEVWHKNQDQEQHSHTGKLDYNFKDILDLEPEIKNMFHTPTNKIKKYFGRAMHDGMINNNFMGTCEISQEHPVHNLLHKKFNIKDTRVHLHVQHPGGIVGMHVDKYRSVFAKGHHDLTKLRLRDIYRGMVFLQDWVVGQTFMTGRANITDWRAGDSYTWPWYMQHGSANASAKPRYLLLFVGVVV